LKYFKFETYLRMLRLDLSSVMNDEFSATEFMTLFYEMTKSEHV